LGRGSTLQNMFLRHEVKYRFTLPIVSKVIKNYHAINIQGEVLAIISPFRDCPTIAFPLPVY
jgi:hypothetical protein